MPFSGELQDSEEEEPEVEVSQEAVDVAEEHKELQEADQPRPLHRRRSTEL